MGYDSSSLVSICLPTRNGEKTLRLALDSIVSQSYDNLEVIISNNNSDDKTDEIIKDYIHKFKNVKYIIQPMTLSSIENLKAVYLEAQGDFIIFAADDDLRDPNYVETLLKGYDKFPESSIIFSDLVIFSDYDEFKDKPVQDFNFKTTGLSLIEKLRVHFNGPFHMYGLIKANYLSEFKWYDIIYGPDHPLLFHLLAQGDFNYISGTKFYFWKPGKPKTLEERAKSYSMRDIDSFYKIKLAIACTKTMIPFMSFFDLLWKPITIFSFIYYNLKGGFIGLLKWWD